MSFHALDAALALVQALRVPLRKIEARDRDLAVQARRAAQSIALNLAEGQRRSGADRQHLFRVAGGSAAELRAALLVASGWGYLDEASLAEPLGLLDRVLAMTWRLGGPRR